MKKKYSIYYKIADTSEEMEQIHRLNYETFVEEIPQHAKSDQQRLVDRFHEENTYWIAKEGSRLIGMVALRGKRPFSLDEKLGTIDDYLPEGANPCEIRLLSVRQEHRGKRVFFELLQRVVESCLQQGYDCALISGTERQARLYQHIGFKPFGPLIGTEQARYQPMLLTQEYFVSAGKLFDRMIRRTERPAAVRLLPGPVPMHPSVQEAWARPPVSHRSEAFHIEMRDLQEHLKKMAGANHVKVAVGTGTMANDLIAGQLSRLGGKGLILSSGEFGERLADQATRWKLPFSHIQKDWHDTVRLEEVADSLEKDPAIQWLWTVHCETSTGYLYPIEELKTLCREKGILMCLDACSSVGTVSVDLSDVHLASAVSGKGLASYPGIALVFHKDPVEADPNLPAFLDLGLYGKCDTVPFTHSSNGVAALHAAVANHRFSDQRLMKSIRDQLTESGVTVLGNEQFSPGIITIVVPDEADSRAIGDALKTEGIEISYESAYLLERNWIQLALMGHYDPEDVQQAVAKVMEILERR